MKAGAVVLAIVTIAVCWPVDARRAELNSDKFEDVTQAAGINFFHFNGMSGEHYFAEMMGSGAALFDYDNDGDLDIFIVQGTMLGAGKTLADARFPPRQPAPLRGRLYRNDMIVNGKATGTLKFTDVTEQSCIRADRYGMGVAAGDFNNDGWVDLYITNFGSSQLWRNNGNGTFTDVTQVSETENLSWGVSAAFLDFDRDGWLDLFVGNYVDFRFSSLKKCFAPGGTADYCGPLAYDPLPNRLLHNRRNGTFEDVTVKAKMANEFYGALGVVCDDFDGDGWMDIYVANDERPNQLWMNQRNGTFKNQALIAGCALSKDGVAQSGMGVDAGDFDNDGDEDLVVTNLKGEYADLYVNDGKGWFEDLSSDSGLAASSTAYSGFGTGFIDYDNDGWLDLVIVNGEVRTIEDKARAGDPYPLDQPKLLLHNDRNGRFKNETSSAGPVFASSEVSRGLAFGDVNNDGAIDMLIVNNNGPARLLVNRVGQQKHWLGLRMIGEKTGRDMLGTRVALFRPQAPALWRRVHTDGSYASSNDPRVLFGLGDSPQISKVRAYWVSGRKEEWTGLPVDRYTTLREGSGRAVD